MESLLRDIRYALRQLFKNLGFASMAILTLALGIGVNTAVFSVVNGWLRPLPVANPEQLVVLAAQQKGDAVGVYYFSYPALVDLRKQADSFSDIFADQIGLGGLSINGKAEPFVFSYVTGNYFSGLGVKPAAGRLLAPGEGETPGDTPVVVLSYSYWKKRFGRDPGVVGRQVRIDGKPAVIIGVAQQNFHGVHSGVEFSGYLPLSMMAQEPSGSGLWTDRSQRILATMGRVKPGLTLTQAQTTLNVVAKRLALQYPKTDDGISITAVPERLSRPIPRLASAIPLISGLFLVLAAFVLLLACMNVGNLLLVRATARQREMVVRTALGATSKRLIRQLLTESIVLALVGGVAGMALGIWASGMIGSLRLGTNLPLLLDFGFDWRVFAYGLAAALATGIIVGVWPAIRATRTPLSAGLQESGRSDSAGGGRHRVRSMLVVAQVAGSLMLLIVAARFVRSLERAQQLSLGFDADHVLNVMLDPHQAGYDETRTNTFYHDLERRVRAIPGVQSASVAFSVPMGNYNDGSQVYIEGHPLDPGVPPPLVLFNRVDGDYFNTTQIALLRGRTFTESDTLDTPLVAIVNQSMANQFWPDQDPIGKRFSMKSGAGPFVQIIGVAHDSKLFGYFSGALPYFYVPFTQNYRAMRIVQIRSSEAPESLETAVRREIQMLDPEMPISDLQTMKESMAGGNGFLIFRLGASLTAIMGVLGLVIATVGVYGVVSFAASQRTREIGVRMALGASRGNILNLILGQGVRLVLIGVVLGLLAAFGLTRAMAGLLVGVTPVDPATSLPVTLILVMIALVACYLPAHRAMRVDPMVALRYE